MAELRDYTSLRVGGPAQKFVEVGTESEIIAAIEAAGDAPILIMGGGTNLLIADSGFAGVVIRITNHSLQAEIDACSGATLTIGAGEDWDEFVATTIDRGFAGLETLSGIPGTVGAAPIQNIGAYGHEGQGEGVIAAENGYVCSERVFELIHTIHAATGFFDPAHVFIFRA